MTARAHFLLAAGGTGGHVFPALALAQELSERGQAARMVTDARGAKYAPAARVLPAGHLTAGGVVGRVKGLFMLLAGTVTAIAMMVRERPALLVCFGGYPALAPALAAFILRVPVLLHEQNAVLGRANRWTAKWARALATSFDAVARVPREITTVKTGNPVRASIAAVGDRAYMPPQDELHILITGGSQGARLFGTVLPDAILALPAALRARLSLAHQARAEDAPRVAQLYQDHGVRAEVAPFFNDMPERLARAHLVIARAGSSTVNELAAAGRPSILIPFARAAEDHQTANARALVAAGGAAMVTESELAPTTMAQTIARLANPETLAAMARAARAQAMPDAARRLADLAESMVRS